MAAARPGLPAGPWLVVGLARSGVAAARVLHARGETVVGVDAGHPGAALPPGVEVHTGSDGLALLPHARAVVKSPGVPSQAPVIAAARERGIPVLGELELAWRLLPNPFVAVTGTNGKTTTVELIGHIHREAGVAAVVAGNVGTALAGLVGELPPDTVVVAEASSFQLEDTEHFAPDAAVLLNVTADHLDRHGTLGAYVEAKLRIFVAQGNDDVAVVPLGLEAELGIPPVPGCAKRVTFGTGLEADLADRAGQLWWLDEPLLAVGELSLRGAHNRQNAMAAAAVAFAGIIMFVGLIVPHVMRLILGPRHATLLPASLIGGALVLVCADLAARTLIGDADLPIGMFTSLIGGPLFFILLRRSRHAGVGW